MPEIIITHPPTKEYARGWERVFGNKGKDKGEEAEADASEESSAGEDTR